MTAGLDAIFKGYDIRGCAPRRSTPRSPVGSGQRMPGGWPRSPVSAAPLVGRRFLRPLRVAVEPAVGGDLDDVTDDVAVVAVSPHEGKVG